MNHNLKAVVAALLVTLTLCGKTQTGMAQIDEKNKVQALFQLIEYAYVDTVDKNKITEDAIRAILKDCDPHSVYIPAEDLKAVNEPLLGKFEGIGVSFQLLGDTIMVTQTISGGPSEKVGLRAGDRIVKIDGINVAGIKLKNNDVMKKLRGDKGTKVTVSVYRRSSPELLDFTITRDKIPLYSVVAAYVAAPEIGYIKVDKFADSTVEEFKAALKKLQEKNIKHLILDLQGNGGGYLERAIGLADEFLDDKKLVVYTKGRTAPTQESFASSAGGFEKGKLVVLIDETSASASEIVSGAIQDWDRGLVVGRRSFGKGLVQKPFPLPDGSAVRLTIARYYTPSGRCIQKPYQPGDEEDYDMDLLNRRNQGEFTNADSIHQKDTVKYFTNARRVVYAGGGIMPDVFVPQDTSMNSKFLFDLIRKGIVNEFTLTYTDDNRTSLLAKYPDIQAFRQHFTIDDHMKKDFLAYAEKQGVPLDESGLKNSGPFLFNQLKALIARDLWDTNAYYEVMNETNKTFLKGIEVIQDNTFSKMKIANN